MKKKSSSNLNLKNQKPQIQNNKVELYGERTSTHEPGQISRWFGMVGAKEKKIWDSVKLF
jgi:hypothetical protein